MFSEGPPLKFFIRVSFYLYGTVTSNNTPVYFTANNSQQNTMKLLLLASLLASVASFQVAPVAQPTSSTSLSVSSLDPDIGVTAPLGLFDPLGWLDESKDPASKVATFHANFERRRAVERKVSEP